MTLKELLPFVERMIERLTWGRLLLLLVAAVSSIALYRLYEDRAAAFSALLSGPLPLVTLVAAVAILGGGLAVERLVRMAMQRAEDLEGMASTYEKERDDCHQQLRKVSLRLDRAEAILAQHNLHLDPSRPMPLGGPWEGM